MHKNFILVLGMDIFLLVFSMVAAYSIRFEFAISAESLQLLQRTLPAAVIIKIPVFFRFDLYRGMWRYTSIPDLLNVIKAAGLSSLILISFILFMYEFEGFSRSVFVLDSCLTILLIAGFRLGVRFYFENRNPEKMENILQYLFHRVFSRSQEWCPRLLIIGAGDCGEKMYREISTNHLLSYQVVGFLDDHPGKLGKKIHGVPVLHDISGLPSVVQKMKIDEVLIAIPSATAEQMRRIVRYCKAGRVKFKTVPGMGEFINGHIPANAIREVGYHDLLGREAIRLDQTQIGAYLRGQRVLVTGAGGSIGAELCRQICRFAPSSIFLLEIAESNLYEVELELKDTFHKINVIPLLADIRSREDLEKIFTTHRPQIVFHAAAYKHVPMLEQYPWKAILTNIFGTRQLIDFSNRFGVERFVLVSSDKAVRPTNVMGASKRIAEMLVQNQHYCGLSPATYITVRFGNVIGSSGSVVPLFKKQIEKGGPLTVTHPDVARYFMMIPEACQLILQAGSMGHGGEIFLLDMGKPVKIDTLARDLIRFSGFEPETDIKIRYIGLRPGEKLYEELRSEQEEVLPTDHQKILRLKSCDCNLKILNGNIDQLCTLACEQNDCLIRVKLQEIVPEYQPWVN
jgi:FlaA1/EpsC-like NDP-sugar epimerase